MDNVFKGLKRDITKFKSKYITPAALEEKAPEMKKAYMDAIDEFMKSPQYKAYIDKQAKGLVKEMIYALLNSAQTQRQLQNLIAGELKKGINITWK